MEGDKMEAKKKTSTEKKEECAVCWQTKVVCVRTKEGKVLCHICNIWAKGNLPIV